MDPVQTSDMIPVLTFGNVYNSKVQKDAAPNKTFKERFMADKLQLFMYVVNVVTLTK